MRSNRSLVDQLLRYLKPPLRKLAMFRLWVTFEGPLPIDWLVEDRECNNPIGLYASTRVGPNGNRVEADISASA